MLVGEVTEDGVPLLRLSIGGKDWPAVLDTRFNGDLELPVELKHRVNATFRTKSTFLLASGVEVVEDVFRVELVFDERSVVAEATFVETDAVLIGTGLLAQHRVEVHFPDRTVRVERVG